MRICEIIGAILGEQKVFGGPLIGGWRMLDEGMNVPRQSGMTGNGTVIYRAHDGRDDPYKIHRYSSWSPDWNTAKAYTDNPGFGGSHIRAAEVNLDKIIDVNPRSEKGLRLLAQLAGYEHPDDVAIDWWNRNIQYPWEEIDGIKKNLLKRGYDWIRYEDDFPEGSMTIVPLKDFDLEEAKNAHRPMLGEAAGDEHVFTVPVKALAAIYNPIEHPPWIGIDRIDPADIAQAITSKKLDKRFSNSVSYSGQSKEYHIQRIAYLVFNPDSEPLIVEPYRNEFDVVDGFHRLAAAIYRGDPTIKVAFGGTAKQLRQWLRAKHPLTNTN